MAPEKTPSPFGRRVADIRSRRGFSQQTVATTGGFSAGYIGGIETGDRGERPSRDYVLKIAKGLKATDAERLDLLRLAGYTPATDSPPAVSFADVVNTDPRLRADQRRILIDLYAAFTGLR